MKLKKLKSFFEDNNFNVHTTKQDNVQCAEIETWTDGGVNMLICLNPFTIDEFKKCVEYFNVDEEITLHRQDKSYCDNFTIREGLEDFEAFNNRLKEIVTKLNLIVDNKK